MFLRFINSIVNDMIYLLDEALAKATVMVELQKITPKELATMPTVVTS